MARRWMIFSRRRRRRRFGTALVVRVGGVVKSPGHETWKRCFFRTSGTKKGKKYSDISELCTFLPEFCICTCCILAFLEISWLEAEAKHHRLFRWGKSAEIQQKLRKNLRSLYIVHGRFCWGFATRIPQQKPPRNFAILFGGGGRAGGQQWGGNMELGNSWRYMDNGLRIAKTLTYCMVCFEERAYLTFVSITIQHVISTDLFFIPWRFHHLGLIPRFAIKRSKWMQHLILGPSSLRECGTWISPI